MFKLPWQSDKVTDYDNVTGMVLPEVLEARQLVTIEQALKDAQDLISLQENPGWQMIRSFMEVDIKKAHESLLQVQTAEDLNRIQQFVLARRTLLQWIDEQIQVSKTLLDEKTQAEKA